MSIVRNVVLPLLAVCVIVGGVISFTAHHARQAMDRPASGRHGLELIAGVDHVETVPREAPARHLRRVTLSSDVLDSASETADGLGQVRPPTRVASELEIVAPQWGARYDSWTGRPNGPLVEWWIRTAARLHEVAPGARLTCESEDLVCEVETGGTLSPDEVKRLVDTRAAERVVTDQERDPEEQVTFRVLADGREVHKVSRRVGRG